MATQASNADPASPKLLWLVLIVVIVLSNVHGVLTQNLDDLSVLRACAFASADPNEPLLETISNHLEASAAEMGPAHYSRYSERLAAAGNYVAQNVLVRLLERGPIYSAFQSVFIANLLVHLVAAIALFLVVSRLFGPEAAALKVVALLGLIPLIALPAVAGVFSPFPLQAGVHSWLTPAPRGSAVCFFFSAFLLIVTSGESSPRRSRRLGVALLLLGACFLSHSSMFLLLTIPTLLIAVAYAMLRSDYLGLIDKIGTRRSAILFNLSWLAIALIKLVWISQTSSLGRLSSIAQTAAVVSCWIVAANVLLYQWVKYRRTCEDDGSLSLYAGDAFARYLIPFAAFGIGFNLFQPQSGTGSWYIPFEAGTRLLGFAHILWWMLLGVLLYRRSTRMSPHLVRRAVGALLAILCLGMTGRIALATRHGNELFEERLLTIRVTSLIEEAKLDAYADEVVYFQAVANELKARQLR